MGLFGSIGSFFGTAAKAVATGGISLVAPKLIPKFIDRPITAITQAQFPTSAGALFRAGAGVATRQPSLLLPQAPANSGGPMAFNLGGILGQVGSIFGASELPALQTLGGLSSFASQFVPGAAQVGVRPPPPTGPLMRGMGAMVGRGFFNRFPNLATVIQAWRNRGVNLTRSKLWSLLKRFGPEILVSGGIITAAAVSELMVAGPGRRRMNPGNAQALRRSLRRVEAFHRLCVRADTIRRRPTRRSRSSSAAPQFVRQG